MRMIYERPPSSQRPASKCRRRTQLSSKHIKDHFAFLFRGVLSLRNNFFERSGCVGKIREYAPNLSGRGWRRCQAGKEAPANWVVNVTLKKHEPRNEPTELY